LSLPSLAQPATQPSTAAARKWELLSYGSGERLWYAVTTPAQTSAPAATVVREREMHDDAWQHLKDFPSRLISMGELQGQLVAALEEGDWKRISAEQFASGPPLPGRGDILALAGEEGSLWAVGFAEGARPEAVGMPSAQGATTHPATTRPAGPTTRPEQLQLYKLTGDTWTHLAALPVEVRAARGEEISLVILKGEPIIAYKDMANVARVLRFNAEKQIWNSAGQMTAGFTLRKVKLLTARDRVIGWVVGESGVGSFFFPTEVSPQVDAEWRQEPLTLPTSVGVMDVSAAAAKDELHLFVIRPDEEFIEQKYDLSGRLSPNSLIQLDSPKTPGEATPSDARNWGLLVLLMVITLVAANKGGVVQVVTVNKVELGLAPFGLRLAAGLIDLWPAYLGYMALAIHSQHGVKLSQLYSDRFAMWTEIITFSLYFLHAAIAEIIWGRSLGKMFVGLRVAGLDGKRAPINAVLLRNFMRLIEVPCMMGFPLLVIFFNPLRQRLGDFAAGTIVVAKIPVKVAKEKEEAAANA
jgi:uncharacterized RDD family membrane protein YckC